MIAKLQPNRVRRTYLGGHRIDAFTGEGSGPLFTNDNCSQIANTSVAVASGSLGVSEITAAPSQLPNSQTPSSESNDNPVEKADAMNCVPPMPRPEDWLASTTQAFNGTREIEGEGLGRLEDGRLVKDVVGELPILVKLLDSDERLVIQAHPTVPCAKRLFNSSVGKTECWYFLPGTASDACVYLGFEYACLRDVSSRSHSAQRPCAEVSRFGEWRPEKRGRDACFSKPALVYCLQFQNHQRSESRTGEGIGRCIACAETA